MMVDSPVVSIMWVGAAIPGLPKAGPFPSPDPMWPFAECSSWLPYMYIERRLMVLPTITFSLVASSMNPAGAKISVLSSAPRTDATPPKWSIWEWVKMIAETGSFPRCSLANAIAAAAVSLEVSGSTMIHPVCPSIMLMLERSKPRSWYTPSVTSKRP